MILFVSFLELRNGDENIAALILVCGSCAPLVVIHTISLVFLDDRQQQ
jgi:uncharacterized paraquat-inducible protein A